MDGFAATPTGIGQRLLLWKALQSKWSLFLLDIATAFLHAMMPEDSCICVRLDAVPEEIRQEFGMLVRCCRALYGLRESPRLFQEELAARLAEKCIRRLVSDPQLFVGESLMLSAHADDLLCATPPEKEEDMKKMLEELFKLTRGPTFGPAWERYLGRLYRRVADSLEVRVPEEYLMEILRLNGFQTCRPVSTPMVPRTRTEETGPLSEVDARGFGEINDL